MDFLFLKLGSHEQLALLLLYQTLPHSNLPISELLEVISGLALEFLDSWFWEISPSMAGWA